LAGLLFPDAIGARTSISQSNLRYTPNIERDIDSEKRTQISPSPFILVAPL
jgi:hypothetical protein